jgi:formate hydrogenlyase subunit 6/NADH:ubiquinone oxidoreductase subunit I
VGDKGKIMFDSTKCVGCLVCALVCSFIKENSFNPMVAYIKISTKFNGPNTISFARFCDNCGVCTQFCAYDALKIKRNSSEDDES